MSAWRYPRPGSGAWRVACVAAVLVAMTGAAIATDRDPDTPTPRTGTDSPLETVRAFMSAFNAHDTAAMKALLAPEASWYSVDGRELVIEAGDRAELLAGMKQYFQEVPDVHSTIEEPLVDGRRVAFRERVTWNGGARVQTAIAVYEVEDQRVTAAWYYPPSRQPDRGMESVNP